MSKIVLIDGHSVIHRCWWGCGGEGSDLLHVQSLVAKTILGFADRFAPQWLVVATESSASWRKEEYPTYKAGRKPIHDELRTSLNQTLIRLRSTLNVTDCLSYEADDVIATLAARTKAGNQTIIVSGDRDLAASVRPGVQLYLLKNRGNHTLFNHHTVSTIFGVPVSRIREFKALAGDSSDGISGVPQIGPKRAITLLSQYPSWLDLQQAKDDDRYSLLVRENSTALQESYTLAGLCEDIPLDIHWESAEWNEHRMYELRAWTHSSYALAEELRLW